MIQLQSGQHYGVNKRTIRLRDCILTEDAYAPHVVVPWHYHENPYFFYHLRGSLTEVNKKKSLICTPGTVLFHHWQEAHYNTKFTSNAGFLHIDFQKSWFERCGINQDFIKGSSHLENPLLKSHFRRICTEMTVNDDATKISIEGLLLQVFSEMLRLTQKQSSKIPSWVNKVKEITHELAMEKITLEFLSAQTGLHPVYLSREFPKYFAATFGEYIRSIKLEKATDLIINTRRPLGSIAYECGFSDQSHLIRTFRQKNGISPLQYRKKIQNNS